jgi:hypothetical protein
MIVWRAAARSFSIPRATQAVVNLRRMLTKAGYGAGAADAGATGREA